MFTGIIQEIGIVKEISFNRITVIACKVLENMQLGESIAVNGACLTVTHFTENSFTVDVMPETLKRTTLKQLRKNEEVNLERALTLDGLLGGHMVQGHVDAMGTILSIKDDDGASIIKIQATKEIMTFVVKKGSITVDGISLTVLDRTDTTFDVSIVAFTMDNTVMCNRKVGDMVNLEADVIAKYIIQFKKMGVADSNITFDFLQENGFLSAG
ncbi:MAG: riboflavin synthase [Dehalococcoidales bacterium]|jgi:riboflavin synthase|nr:riboflavin synthase [Dehalococcoidales bacterium]